MIIDFMPVTLVDFPGNIATTVFIGGCNLKCSYCHNSELINKNNSYKSEDDFFRYLKSRKSLIKAVCITGGEPTLWSGLFSFIYKLKSLSYKVKLDTNGTNSQILSSLIENDLLDYVAMDIKTIPSKYSSFGATSVDLMNILNSVKVIMSSNIPYEFRTTVVEHLILKDDLKEIGNWLKGASNYVLQGYKYNDNVLDLALCKKKNCSKDYLEQIEEVLRPYFSNIKIRC